MPLKKAGSVYILVVEDDKSVREFLADQLTDQGYKIMTADNGAEAVECVQNSKFHVVISGFRMPGMDGIQTLEAIKKIDPEVPIILSSGHGNAEVAAEAMKKGAYHFLQKPFRMNELFRLIEKALEKSEQKGLEALLEAAMDRLKEHFHADEGSLMLTDKAKRLYIACGRGLSEETVYSTTLKLGERVAGLAAQESREYLINGGLEKYPEFRGIEKKPRIRSSIVIPVHCEGKLLGVLNLNRTKSPDDFTHKDLRGVSHFVSQIAPAIQSAKRDEDLEAARREQIIRQFSSTPTQNQPR